MYRILFICTAFAPKNVIGSIRPSKIAKYLVRQGHEVTVYMPEGIPGEPQDSLLLGPEIEKIQRIEVPYSQAYRKIHSVAQQSRSTKSSSNVSGLRGFARFAYLLLNEYNWSRRTIASIKKNLPAQPYDIVLSTYPNIGTHWVASAVRRKGWAKTWIADFRDPMVYDFQDSLQKVVNKRLQTSIEKKSDVVLTVSRGVMEKLPVAASLGKLHWLPNGFDPEDMPNVLAEGTMDFPGGKNQLVLSYAGSLYGGQRNLNVVFESLKSLMDQGLMQRDELLVLYAGKEEDILRAQAQPYGLEDCIHGLGRVERKVSIQMQQYSDAPMICSFNTRSNMGIMTGKVYEVLMIGKPVIAIINGNLPGSELGKMLRELNAGVVYEEGNHEQDFKALREYLLTLYTDKKNTGKTEQKMDEDKKSAYGHDRLTQRLLSIIEDALG